MILGITGSFGSGKSTVARIFKSLAGAQGVLIDADAIARKALCPGTLVYRRVKSVFGTVNRAELAVIVFQNQRLLRKLTAIIHPVVLAAIKKKLKSRHAKVIILDAPLLIEAGLRNKVDRLVVVKARREIQIRRLTEKRGFKREDVLKRINSQMPLGKKIRLADFIIDNNKDKSETRKQAVKIWRLLWKN